MALSQDDINGFLSDFALLTREEQDRMLAFMEALPDMLDAAGASGMGLKSAIDAGLIREVHRDGWLMWAPTNQLVRGTETSEISPLFMVGDGHAERWEAVVSDTLRRQPASKEEVQAAYSFLCYCGWDEGSLNKTVVWQRMMHALDEGSMVEEIVRAFPVPGDPPPDDAISKAPLN